MPRFLTTDNLLVMALLTLIAALVVICWYGRIKRTKPIRVPDSVHLYERNAFQVLGLSPLETTTRLIMRRRDELQVALDGGLVLHEVVPGYRPIRWPWAEPVTTAAMQRAVGKLQNEVSRIEEEMCWFHLDEEDPQVLSALAEGDLAKARSVWDSRRAHGISPYIAGQAAHNLAVLSHAEVLHAERLRAQVGVLDAKHLKSWRAVLQEWGAVHADDAGWKYFELRCAAYKDPRVNEDFCRGLRSTVPERILRINVELARAAIAQDNHSYARGHVDLIRNAPFLPEDMKIGLVAAVLEPHALEIRELFQPIVEAESKLSSSLDLAGIRKQFQKVLATVRKVGGETALAPVVSEIIPSVQKPLVEELRIYVSSIHNADIELWKMNNELVGLWNKSSNRDELRAISRALGERASEFQSINEKLREADAKAILARRLLGLLREMCVQGTETLHKDIAVDLEFASNCVSKARAEVDKTRAYFDRNYNGMRQVIGA